MLVKMVKGGYGHKENGYTVLKRATDEPFDVDETTAKRLCDELEVAIRVEEEVPQRVNNELIQRYKDLGGKGCPNSWKTETLKAKIQELEEQKSKEKAEEEAKKLAEEQAKQAEEARKLAEEEAKKLAEEQAKQAEEARKLAEEEAKKANTGDEGTAEGEGEDEDEDKTSKDDENSDEDEIVDGEIETDEDAPDFDGENGVVQ